MDPPVPWRSAGAQHEWIGVRIDAAAELEPPFGGRPFACLLWDHAGSFSVEERSAVVERLLDAGSRSLVCGGETCELWHDIADEVHVERWLDCDDAPDFATSWHDAEPPEDVAFFLVRCTSIDDRAFSRFLVLEVGRGPEALRLARAVEAGLRDLAAEDP